MWFRRLTAWAPALVLVAASVAACGDHDRTDALAWGATDLPVRDGGRAVPRAATWCAGRWALVGATADARGLTRAAVWTSPDGRGWQPLEVHPRGDLNAARGILTSAGCSQGRLAALSVKGGGTRGGLRTRSWLQRPDGSLAAVPSSYLLFGGPQAVSASRVEGGPGGYLVAGSRFSGAAVWTSRTGASYRLHEGEPGLADTRVTRTQAVDAAPDADRWVVVGTTTHRSGRLSATAWMAGEPGRWARLPLPGAHSVSTADRAIAAGAGRGTLVAGVLDQRFGLWLGQGSAWLLEDSFGRRDLEGTSAPYVSGLAVAAGRVLATYSDGVWFHLAVVSGGDQADSPLPALVRVNGDHAVTVATHGSDALLLTDDGIEGRAWLAHVSPP